MTLICMVEMWAMNRFENKLGCAELTIVIVYPVFCEKGFIRITLPHLRLVKKYFVLKIL